MYCIYEFPLTLAICAVYHGNQNNGGDITSEVILGLLVFNYSMFEVI